MSVMMIMDHDWGLRIDWYCRHNMSVVMMAVVMVVVTVMMVSMSHFVVY